MQATLKSIVESDWLLVLKVVELGGITRAAAALGVPQSYVSRRIAELERQCGARLFERTGRGVALTAFGHYLLPKVKDIVSQSDRLVGEILSSGGAVMGDVRIGLLPSLVPLLGSKLLRLLRERFPQLRVHLTEGASAFLEEHLRDGRLDIATVLRDDAAGKADGLVLWRLPLYLVGSLDAKLLENETVPFDALDGLPLVLPGEPHVMRARLASLCRQRGINLSVAVEANSIRLQHQIAAAGAGFAITARPQSMTDVLQASRIVSPGLTRSIILSTTPRRNETLGTRGAYRLIAEVAPSTMSVFGAADAADT